MEELEPEEEPEPADVVFPGLFSRESRRRYLASLAAEGLFVLDLTAEMPAPARPPASARAEPAVPEALPPIPLEEVEPPVEAASEIGWEVAEAPIEIETAAPVGELEETTPWSAEPPPLAAEAPAPPQAEATATATLGELYLRQGHLAEAERIFREVLHREPDNSVARQGLARAAARPAEWRPLEGRDLLAGYQPAAGGEVEAKARKRWVLNSYLQRLRRGGQRDVS
jgi:hypothetical protein